MTAWLIALSSARPAAAQEGFEVQARGPIHEAFADATPDVAPRGPVVNQQPPQPINEIPPDVKPDEAGTVWIPGYWAWDDERNDFLWISGVWRVAPPDVEWVPGYWTQVEGGFQWIAGFWMNKQIDQISYLPPPPDSLENGPSSPPPGDNFFYVSGQWAFVNGQYVWQPGYWYPYQTGWTWCGSRYSWTPSGYVYVPGWWDYPFSSRGFLYAPVAFQPGYWARPGFAYRPNTLLNTAFLLTMMFARPNNGWYYYGDYFGNNYAGLGYRPWYAYGRNGQNFNNLYAYERWSNRQRDPDWDDQLRRRYDEGERNPDARPPRSWDQWQERMRDRDGNVAGRFDMAARGDAPFVSLDEATRAKFSPLTATRAGDDVRRQSDAVTNHFRQLTEQRRKTEVAARADAQPGGPAASRPQSGPRPGGTLQLPRLPQLNQPQQQPDRQSPQQHRVARPFDQSPRPSTSPSTVVPPQKGRRENVLPPQQGRPDSVVPQPRPTLPDVRPQTPKTDATPSTSRIDVRPQTPKSDVRPEPRGPQSGPTQRVIPNLPPRSNVQPRSDAQPLPSIQSRPSIQQRPDFQPRPEVQPRSAPSPKPSVTPRIEAPKFEGRSGGRPPEVRGPQPDRSPKSSGRSDGGPKEDKGGKKK